MAKYKKKYANGGELPKVYNPNNIDKTFIEWYNTNTPEGKAGIPYSQTGDYDYFSFYKSGEAKNYKGGHFPDTFKRTNHETFSNESLYSIPENPGGQWKGEKFNPKGKFKKADGGNLSYNGNPVSDSSTDAPNPNAKQGISAGQYLNYGTAALGAYNQINNTYSNPNTTDAQKGDAAYSAGVGAVSAVNPIIGGFINIGDAVGKPIKNSVERTDSEGNLSNENAAKAGYVAGTLFNPAKSLSNTMTDKNASTGQKVLAGLTGGISNVAFTGKYTSKLEKDNKAAIEQQRELEAQNALAQQQAAQAQQDYINQQVQASLAAQQQQSQMGMGGKMKGGKKCANGGNLTSYNGGFRHSDTSSENIHEGIPVGESIVETGETRGIQDSETEDYIFSDRLKVPGKKMTFAKVSKMIENKFSKRDNDKMSLEQKKLELNKLMNDQEMLRQKMINGFYNKIQKAFGGSLSESFGEEKVVPNTSTQTKAYPVYQNVNGTAVKSFVNTTPQDFNKLNRTGNNLLPLQGATPITQEELKAQSGTANYMAPYTGAANLNIAGANSFRMTTDGAGNKYYWKGNTPISEAEYRPQLANGGKIKSYDEELAEINKQYAGTKYDTSVQNDGLLNNMDYNSLYNVGNFLGAGYDIYRGLKGAAPVNYERINPELVNYSASRDLVRRDLQTGFDSARNAVRGVVNSPAQYLSLVTQLAANRDNQIADTVTRSQEAESNSNAQIRNQAKAANAQTQRLEADARSQERDIASNTLQTGLTNFGNSLANTGRDKQLKISQDEAKQFIGSADYAPVFNKKGKITGYRHRLSGQTYNIKD